MAFAGPSYRHAEFYTAQVFSGLFGGGMSSRLFQEVRERRGLCYAIYSSCWALADSGLFGIHAATGPEMMGKLIDVVGEQLVRAAAEKPPEAELARVQGAAEGRPADGAGKLSARAEQMARQLLLFDRLIEHAPSSSSASRAVTAERRARARRQAGGRRTAVGRRGGRRPQGRGLRAQMAERAATRVRCARSRSRDAWQAGDNGVLEILVPASTARSRSAAGRSTCAIRPWATMRPGRSCAP